MIVFHLTLSKLHLINHSGKYWLLILSFYMQLINKAWDNYSHETMVNAISTLKS
jgi:hypothetical protein